MPRPLTPEKRAMILADYLNGSKIAVIALEHNVSLSTAATLAKRAGLHRRRQARPRIYVHRNRGGRFIRKKIVRDWLIVT
jgi:DNA-directed RNA polymerase specialized sigma24 family protein